MLERPGDPLAELPMSTDEKYLSGQVVLVGYGRVGRRIGDALAGQGIPFVVAEQNREMVERLRAKGIAAVSGDASDPAVLIQAHIARASMLVVATPDTFDVRQMIKTARTLNPGIETVVRTHNEEEAGLLGVASRNGKNSTLRVVLPSHPQEFKPITAGCAIRCYMAVKRLACNPQFLA